MGKLIKPTPEIDEIIEADVLLIKTIVSNNSVNVFRVSKNFLFLFGFMVFFFELCDHFLNVVNMVNKTFYIIYFHL